MQKENPYKAVALLAPAAFTSDTTNTMPTLLMYGNEDVMVVPEVAKACGAKLGAEMLELGGADHGYGFYSDETEYTDKIVETMAAFFEKNLK